MGTAIKTILQGKRAGDPPVLVADPTKASNILGWQSRQSALQLIMQSAYVFTKTTLRLRYALAQGNRKDAFTRA